MPEVKVAFVTIGKWDMWCDCREVGYVGMCPYWFCGALCQKLKLIKLLDCVGGANDSDTIRIRFGYA